MIMMGAKRGVCCTGADGYGTTAREEGSWRKLYLLFFLIKQLMIKGIPRK